MTDSMRTTKEFYRNALTGEVLVIETSHDGHIIAASGPIEPPLQSLDTYELNTHRNSELEAMNDKLILI